MKKLIFIFTTLYIVSFSLTTVTAREPGQNTLQGEEVIETETPEGINAPFNHLEEYIKTVVENNSNTSSGNFSGSELTAELWIPIVGIVFGTIMPVLILAIIFYTRYKTNRAKYALAEKALATGKDIPEGLFHVPEDTITPLSKGIKNMCLGIGLFVFLWAIEGEFWMGCIGLFVFLNGFGQVLIYVFSSKKTLEKGDAHKGQWEPLIKEKNNFTEASSFIEIVKENNDRTEA